MDKPREFFAYYSPEEKTLKAGANYGCTDGWEELTVVVKSEYDEFWKSRVDTLLEMAMDYGSEAASFHYTNRIKLLEKEIEVLRRYGNKDCTAMADEALANPEEE